MRPNRACAALFLLTAALPAFANGIDRLQNLSQAEFRLLSEDLGAAFSYKPLLPAAPLGFPGFDVSVAATGTHLKHKDLLQRASSTTDEVPATVAVPQLRASLGLPLNLELSGMYSLVPKMGGAKVVGGALAWAFVPGDVALPALGIRASYTRLLDVSQLDLSTAGIDASISKGFAFVTPYLGGGRVWTNTDPVPATGLHSEAFGKNKVYAGLSFKMALVHLGLEWDRIGVVNSYGAKFGLRF